MWATRSGEDLRTGTLRQLNGRHPHTTGRGMNQNPLTRTHPGQPIQPVVRRQKRDGNGHRLLGAKLRRLGHHEVGRRCYERAESSRGHPHHFITHREAFNPGPDRNNLARTLTT